MTNEPQRLSICPASIFDLDSKEISAFERRFWSKVEKTDRCWNWRATIGGRGYGQIRVRHKLGYAHRLAYELTKGRIPTDLSMDHLCRNRACVNPDHMEAVTPKINNLRGISQWAINARKTHCPNGHALIPENLTNHESRLGMRKCRLCHNASSRRTWHKTNG